MLDKPTNSLSDLAHRIDVEHHAVGVALTSALGHAINAGELLIKAKRQVRRDKHKWLLWLAANCSVRPRTASHYMALAKRRAELCDANGNVLPISVRRALDLLLHPSETAENPEDRETEPSFNLFGPKWGRLAWGEAFNAALQGVTCITKLNPPAPCYVVRAARAGKTPGLTAPALREAIALLARYADVL